LVLVVLFALLGPLVGHDPFKFSGQPYEPPSSRFWLGTDELGRDIVARLAAGARVSLLVGIVVQILSLVIGVTFGVIGTFAPRWVATPLLRFTDGMFAFPDILLAILLIGILTTAKLPEGAAWAEALQSGVLPVIVALSITAWPSITRLTMTQLATLKDREFVVAAKANGASTYYLVTRHILPQLWGLLLAVSMVELAGTILAESTLSFLGIGVRPPNPSWGSMINNARQDMTAHPILLVWPCVLLSLTIFALNFVGDGLRARLDPKNSSIAD
jgi:ABC-type dipeptide/oligopeptide/nickel transport system permease subunit